MCSGGFPLRSVLIGLALSSALGGAALAQQGPPDPARLHDDLHLSADQDPAWRQYMAAMNDGGRMMSQRQGAETLMPQLQTPRRLALMQATLEQEVEAFRRQSIAINAFYGRLTPDQQRTFDRETLPPQGGQQGAPQR
jgi:hypothetical protein